MEFQEESTDVKPVAEPPQEVLQTPAETAPSAKKMRTRKLKAKPKTGVAGGAQQKKKPAT
jgi:hypothetical protein